MNQTTPDGRRIYTVGYEGRAIGDFLATLLSLRIKTLIDVRDSASSRKLGFSSGMLQRLTKKIGIEYHHLAALGVPPNHRDDFRRLNTVERARSWYRNNVVREGAEVVSRVVELCREGDAALLCYERDARYCHRYPLAIVLAQKTGLGVLHL